MHRVISTDSTYINSASKEEQSWLHTKCPLEQQLAVHKQDIGVHRYCVGSIQFEGVLLIAKF